MILFLSACDRQSDSQATPIPAPSATATALDPDVEPIRDAPAAVPPTATTVAGDTQNSQIEGAVLMPTATPTTQGPDASAQVPNVARGRVNATLVNVRAAPNMNANLLATAAQGTEFDVIATSEDGRWLQICCVAVGDGAQWINREFVDADIAQVPAFQPDALSSQLGQDQAAALADDDGANQRPSVVVAVDLANVRSGPGTGYAVTAQTARGRTLNITGRNEAGDWLQICCVSTDPTQQTWLNASVVDINGAVQTVPVVAAPELPAGVAPAPSSTGGAAEMAAASAPGLPGSGEYAAPGDVNPLTGQPLAGDAAGRRPVVVCINNDFAARPQFGISQADVMYEYLMEGFGITRFSGLFYGDNVAQIGPVRSARLINYYLGALYEAGLVCSGASDPVRYTLKHEAPFPYLDIDLDDPSNSRYSTSVGNDYRTRLRTDSSRMVRWLNDWGVQQQASLRGFTFGNAPEGGRSAGSIAIPYPSATGSNVAYRYDAGSGRYLRTLGGTPHLDGNSGAQVGVANVVVQYIPHQVTDIVEDSLGSLSIRLNLFGTGRAIVFRDGQAYDGTWQSNARGDTPRFFDASGNEIALKPGRTWVSVVPLDYAVTYQ